MMCLGEGITTEDLNWKVAVFDLDLPWGMAVPALIRGPLKELCFAVFCTQAGSTDSIAQAFHNQFSEMWRNHNWNLSKSYLDKQTVSSQL